MDEELRTYLTAMEDRFKVHVDERVESIKTYVDDRLDRAATAIEAEIKAHVDERVDRATRATAAEIKAHVDDRLDRATRATAAEIGALHTDIRQVETRFTAKLDDFHNRIDRHAGMLQTGARQLTRAFRDDERLSKQWRLLAKRVDALEPRPKNGNGQLPAEN